MRCQLEEDKGQEEVQNGRWEILQPTCVLMGQPTEWKKLMMQGRGDKYKNKVLGYAMGDGIQQTPTLAFDSSRFSPSIVTGVKAELHGQMGKCR